jgi:hypothetical protein
MDMHGVAAAARAAWSDEHVCRVAPEFLELCGWRLEADETWIEVPPDVELYVLTRAVVLSEHGFGDHLLASVYLGAKRQPPNVWPVHGVLRLHLNLAGNMITEDRYTVRGWMSR